MLFPRAETVRDARKKFFGAKNKTEKRGKGGKKSNVSGGNSVNFGKPFEMVFCLTRI